MIHDDQGEIKQAIESFKKAVELNPDETYPYIFLSSVLSKKSKLEEVEKVLKIALEKNGDIDEVNYNLSLNHARKGTLIIVRLGKKNGKIKYSKKIKRNLNWGEIFYNFR